jgi:hypothetical protein
VVSSQVAGTDNGRGDLVVTHSGEHSAEEPPEYNGRRPEPGDHTGNRGEERRS